MLSQQNPFDQYFYFIPPENIRKAKFSGVFRGYKMRTLVINESKVYFTVTASKVIL